MRIFIIAGHGAGDPGAEAFGYTEAERVRAVAKRVKKLGGDNVILGDLKRNYYRDNGISRLNLPDNVAVLEIHMDSAGPSARGGHVIIQEGLKPDKHDKALAKNISDLLPGRADTIVVRNNLANPKRAKARGINYRLLELGFLSNKKDLEIVNTKTDQVAMAILKAFNIPVVAKKPTKPAGTSKLKADGKLGKKTIAKLQEFLRKEGYRAGNPDGKMDAKAITALQNFLNDQK